MSVMVISRGRRGGGKSPSSSEMMQLSLAAVVIFRQTLVPPACLLASWSPARFTGRLTDDYVLLTAFFTRTCLSTDEFHISRQSALC